MTLPYQAAWAIFFLPLGSFLVIGLLLRPFLKNKPAISGYLTIAAILGSFVLSIWALRAVMAAPEHIIDMPDVYWAELGVGVSVHVGILMDSLTAIMLIVVTFVSLMVQIYSQGYMKGDAGYHRYYAWMSLFTASMIGLVLMDSLLCVFVFWELVGLCSYLLIGFWFHKPSAANAAKKAFIVTRLGDFGFLAAILLLYANTGSFDIVELRGLAAAGALSGTVLTWAAIGIFSGAAGKSAQFPLHVWLPDAMEGPTPVSALIHAATMVAAGVFLVARTFPLFEHSDTAVLTVAIIGGFTAIFAATMGLVMNDIKRVLAYSTISQLGYMMLGLATGGVAVGIFHLFNHAFFKALLFLGAGSVNHATGTFDMRLMGGLRKAMPWTFATFVIGSLSLAGIWPLAGFWSKDEILLTSLEQQPVLFVLALITVFMTAFYMFRAVFMTFGGEYRGGAQEEGHSAKHGPHESPVVMVLPLVLLAIAAIASGWLNIGGGFSSLLGHGEAHGAGFFGILAQPLPCLSLALAVLGIFLAYAIYSKKWLSAERIGKMFAPFYHIFSHKYYMDDLYEGAIVRTGFLNGIFSGLQDLDTYVVDGTVNGVGKGAVAGGHAVRRIESGELQLYGIFIAIGIVAIAVFVFLFG